ncbi:MAG: hypothetical protein MI807_10400 [Verrucomicrobiales bacterium]|nr:hypothetical protein [Verrucomicrobiales bacterium]
MSHFFLFTANWNETSYLIGLDSVSGSIRLKFERANGGAYPGSYTGVEKLETPGTQKGAPTDEDIFGSTDFFRAPVSGTLSGTSDLLRPFEIDSGFSSANSYLFMVTIPYWLLFFLAIAFVVIARIHPTRTEQDGDGQALSPP